MKTVVVFKRFDELEYMIQTTVVTHSGASIDEVVRICF